MTKWLTVAASCLLATSVYAGEWKAGGKDPHHGMEGGCESKAKIAKLKELHGKDFLKQHPLQSRVEKSDNNDADAKKTTTEQFI